MHVSNQSTDGYYAEEKPLFSHSYISKEEFVRHYHEKAKAENLVLTELENIISEDHSELSTKMNNLIDHTNSIENEVTLKDYCVARKLNLVILACKHNKVQILEYILRSDNLLTNLSITYKDEDEAHHNAFYYAIRSNNIEIFNALINNWPDNYFSVHEEELDEILATVYDELKLKNVPLSDEMVIFVENKLINIRFFSNTSGSIQRCTDNLDNTIERIELVLQNISLLKKDYSNHEKVDGKFLFVAKFIAQNIHILKQQLRSTYARIPWEEMEFCLVSFVSSYTKRQEVNLFFRASLNKGKILKYLEYFATKLQEEKDILDNLNIGQLSKLPRLKRADVLADIIRGYPQFAEFYDDYQKIRDIYSLGKISNRIKLALSANPKEKYEQLIITRALQITGEHLKNTLESPKLSNNTSDLLLLSLPKNTRQIFQNLRDSLSHANSLGKRIQIEEIADVNFFVKVQNDIKKFGDVIIAILNNNKIKTVRKLLQKIVHSKNADEIKEIAEDLNTVELDEFISGNFKMMEYVKLEKLIKELSDIITDKTNDEMELFNEINNIILNCAETQSKTARTDFITGVQSLQNFSMDLNFGKNQDNIFKSMKEFANRTLEKIAPKIQPISLKEISVLLRKMYYGLKSKIQFDNLDIALGLIYEISFVVEFGTYNIKWIGELTEKLNAKDLFSAAHNKQRINCNVIEEKYNNVLEIKLSELKSILSNNSQSNRLIEIALYESNKKLQAGVEMLVLDIMSILDSSKQNLENDQFILEDNTPLLVGKCLRKYLAHDNTVVDVLLSDSSRTVILNADKLTKENIMTSNKNIGKLVNDDPFKLKVKYDQGLVTVNNKEKLFDALQEGNLENLQVCLGNGTDVYARSTINLWTTLHYAAKGPSLELVKFILAQNIRINVKDIDGYTPLHIAAAQGRTNTVEFLVKQSRVHIDSLNNEGRTPLHLAVQNCQKDTVEILLKNGANTVIQDIFGLPPLHYAIRFNYIDIAVILLAKEINVDINESFGGVTPLHRSAENGHLEIVKFLLQNKADVNARTDNNGTPLHAASRYGHVAIANALILKGANINARIINGCTPLHFAVRNGHEEIVNILLNHQADVNAVDKTSHITPLHDVAMSGRDTIVKALLKSNASANVTTIQGITPLHFAAQNSNLETVTALLKHGVDINAKDANNTTSLHHTAKSGHQDIAKLLIKNNADVNAKDNYKLTPLYVAAGFGNKDVTYLLISNQAEIKVRDAEGGTPLYAAAVNGSKDIIELLIKNNAEVNAILNDGRTPLHEAALNGHTDAVDFLIKHEAEVNARDCDGYTPLHFAAEKGHKDVVNLLIKNQVQIDARSTITSTPLQSAIESGHKEIVEILIAHGANVNIDTNGPTPLEAAVNCNRKDIVEVLIANGANVNADGLLMGAVLIGYRDIVDILLKNKACVNLKGIGHATPLHFAAKCGHKQIVNALIKRGADVEAKNVDNITPLYVAAEGGYEEVIEILISRRANVDSKSNKDITPLHIAIEKGHNYAVKVLLQNQTNIDVRGDSNTTPIELAVFYGNLQVIKMLMQHKTVYLDSKYKIDWTILHIASQSNNLEVVKYLVEKGSDIYARNALGAMPIHIAAREGHTDTVEFFLSKGFHVNHSSADNPPLLHYVAKNCHLELLKCLILNGADVNVKDTDGFTPMHVAANSGKVSVIEILLQNGAIYNAVGKLDKRPLNMAKDNVVINLLESTEKLFAAAKCGDSSKVINCIKSGAFVNAKDTEFSTPLHYTAWKGHYETVNILLKNKADPNVGGHKGLTPLHYAATFSHLNIVKALLSKYAVYNALSDSGKTPSDCAVDESITRLFKLVDEIFKNINNGNPEVVNDINKIKDFDTLKAIMNARNRENKTLVVVAMLGKFPKVDKLKEISQASANVLIDLAKELLHQSNYEMALYNFKKALEKREDILGSDDPGTLDIQTYIANVLYLQRDIQQALNAFEEIFRKQRQILGSNDQNTLKTRSIIATMLYDQGKYGEAFKIYQEVYQNQKEVLGLFHIDTLNTQLRMSLILHSKGKYEEALNINRAAFEKRKELSQDPIAQFAQNNIALILTSQGKYEEALKIYEQILEKNKMVLGINHSITLTISCSIAGLLLKQRKHSEALKAFQQILEIQKSVLKPEHPDIWKTQFNITNVLISEGKLIGALRVCLVDLDNAKMILGPGHMLVSNISKQIERLDLLFKIEGTSVPEIRYLQEDITISSFSN